MGSFLDSWREKALRLKLDVYALYLAYRDPRTPWAARIVAFCVAAYAFSPIDLIPDPIPILGYLDDLIILPLGVLLALRLVPEEVMAESRERAKTAFESGKPVNRVAALVIVLVWILGLVLVSYIAYRIFRLNMPEVKLLYAS